MKASLQTTMFCKRKAYGLLIIQQKDKSTQKEDIFAQLGKAKFFTMLNLKSGYPHIALDDDAIRKTAFVTPLGKYEYLKVPFGLAQVPAYFQNLMNKVLSGLHFTLAYLDDVIIFSELASSILSTSR